MRHDTGRILIIDDSELVLDAAQLVLEEYGFVVQGMRDPAMLEAGGAVPLPDLVLLDANIPGYDGDELVTRVRRATPSARLVIFSGASPDELAGLAANGRTDGFISKLENLDTLPGRIARLLGAA